MPEEMAAMLRRNVIYRSKNMCVSWSEFDPAPSFFMQLSIGTNYTSAVNTDYIIVCTKLLPIKQQLGHVYGEYKWNVNNFWSGK
jgi:hypothetical protein